MTGETMTVTWYLNERCRPEAVGLLPAMINPYDERSLVDQIDETYAHGGGWHEFSGFTLALPDRDLPGTPQSPAEVFRAWRLNYPGDPAFVPMSFCQVRDETLVLWPGSFVTIVKPDGTFRCARVD